MTIEDKFELPRRPAETCPMIDKAIDIGKKSLKIIKYYDRSDDVEELKDFISDVEYEIDSLEGYLEKVRDNVVKIREWGQAWKDLAIELNDKLDAAFVAHPNLDLDIENLK